MTRVKGDMAVFLKEKKRDRILIILVSCFMAAEVISISYLPIIDSRFFSHKLIDTKPALKYRFSIHESGYRKKKPYFSQHVPFNTNKLRELPIPFVDLSSSSPKTSWNAHC